MGSRAKLKDTDEDVLEFENDIEKMKEAADVCPVDAIHVEE